MNSVLEILEVAVLVTIDALGLLIFVRVILSLFGWDENRFGEICYALTEPIVAPVRSLTDRIPGLGEMGIDFSYMATYFLLTILRIVLLSVT